MARHVVVAAALLAPLAAGVAMRGISYGVSPDAGDQPRNDDFFCKEAAPQWSRSGGRGDLALMQALGANSVRLYGNDPRLDHRGFLDEAHSLGLSVVPGNSDWPFSQAPDSCMAQSNFDCSSRVQSSYADNLRNGFLVEGQRYHPALSYYVVMNEPDMKLGSSANFCKAIISAVDGMLEAEKELKVNASGGLPKFTATFSWAPCAGCDKYANKYVLGNMWQLRDAFLHPAKYGYTPKNNLSQVYKTRFVNSFNTANPSIQMRELILDDYVREFPDTPVFIGEYHWNNPTGDQGKDLKNIMSIMDSSPLFLGISFFEFQKRSDAGGHQDFGIFQNGGSIVSQMEYFGGDYGIKCLMPVQAGPSTLASHVAQAFGGKPGLFEGSSCLTGAAVPTVPPPAPARAAANSTHSSGVNATPAAANSTHSGGMNASAPVPGHRAPPGRSLRGSFV